MVTCVSPLKSLRIVFVGALEQFTFNEVNVIPKKKQPKKETYIPTHFFDSALQEMPHKK